MASEAALTILALIVIVVCVAALLVSGLYSIPYAVRRVRANPEPGARRAFAVLTLLQILAPTLVVVCFLVSGIGALAIEDLPTRQAVVRSSLVVGIVILAAQVVLVPVGHRYVQEMAEREAGEREERGVSKRLDAAERKSEDRYSESELEKGEVRRRLDIQEENVGGKLDEILDILRRGHR